MSKRKYTHIKAIEPQIISMRKAGMPRQEIADELGLSKEQIKYWVNATTVVAKLFYKNANTKQKAVLERMDNHQNRIFKRK